MNPIIPILHHHQRQQVHKPQPTPKPPSHRLRGGRGCENSGAWTEKDRGRESRLR
ncbi:hypothetical protein BJ165DRAFT_1427018 [Panaeolus papilionaceus]|nr:hypothetical protein BJ165DRAFT_1427018 [Panaeolus papilionaceus]